MKFTTQSALLFSLLVLGLSQLGCEGGRSSTGNNKQGLVQSGLVSPSDIKHMRGLANSHGGTVRMDLSDEVQYRFLLSRVAASGKTRQNSPQFFTVLDGMRQRHLARKQAPSVTTLEGTKPKDHVIGDVVRLDDGVTFRVTSFATIQDGADYNFVDVVVWDETGAQQLSDYGWGEEYADGRKIAAQATGPLPTTGAMFVKADSINLVSVGGVEESFYIEEKTKVPAAAPGGQMIHPKDSTGDGVVTICLDRNYGDCDYPMVGYQSVKIPLKGSIIFPFPVKQIVDDNLTTIKLVDRNGGPRQMAFGPFARYITRDGTDPRKVSWDVPQELGQFNGILFQRYEDVDFFLSIHVVLDRGPGTKVTTKISSIDRGLDVSTGGMPESEPVQIVYSCLAKGTQVQLANGKAAKIEDIQRKTLVKSDGSGLELPVSDISVGIERIPMVRIADSAGRDLLLTSSHPVMTPDKGAVWAEELGVGSKVLTNTGVSTLVKVSREMYTDNVYNLKLDRSHLKGHAKGSTMYANGYLVGDLAMQKAYEFKNSKDLRADVLSRLPAAWHADYRNSVKVAAR